MFAAFLFSAFLFLSLPFSSALPQAHNAHSDASHLDEPIQRSLPGRWYHDQDHPAHALFRRQSTASSDGVQYSQVGSPAWAAAYPTGNPDPNAIPQSWVDAFNSAVAAGKIPNIPIPTVVNSSPAYPQGVDATNPAICSAYYKCRAPGDIWDAPSGVFGVGFDDGPYLGSAKLYDFLKQNNQRATHFMIGINILHNPDLFLRAFVELQDDIAVHTWSHRYMSTLSNMDLVAEFGWSMQIIHNSTGGRLPRFWRPPYGDADNRVRAIAREVFGLEIIVWNQDTADWSLASGGTTPAAINASMTKWFTGPKNPGLIILEHELSNQTVQAFQDAYPLMVSQGWMMPSVATINGSTVYLNSMSDTGSVKNVNGVLLSNVNSSLGSTTPSSTTLPLSSSSSAGNKTGSSVSQRPTGSSIAANSALRHSTSQIGAILAGALLAAFIF